MAVAQRCHEQSRSGIAVGAWHPGERPFAVVHLHLFARQKGQTIKLFGFPNPKLGNKPFDGVVRPGKAMCVDQILIDRYGIAAQP